MSEPETILLMDNGRLNIITEIEIKEKKCIILVELDTVKDINNKNSAYNLIISFFSAQNNYIRNNIKKHAVDIKYKKDGLSQVNYQLYEWLATINDKPSSTDTLPHNNQKSKNSEKNDFNTRDINDPKIIENEVSSLKQTGTLESDNPVSKLTSIDSIFDSSQNINPSQQKNSINGTESNPNVRKSKDDTIYDSSEIEDLFDDYEDSGNDSGDDKPVDVKNLLRHMSPDEAIFRLSDRIGQRAVEAIRSPGAEWVRRRIQQIYWKQWKKIKTKHDNLVRLGINNSKAWEWTNSGKAYWRIADSYVLHRSLRQHRTIQGARLA